MGLRFTMRTKTNKQGVTIRYKAHLVVQGTNQPKSSFKDTFAPTAKFSSIHLLLATVAKRGYDVHQCDVDSAFPQAELDPDEVVFIRLPKGMHDPPAYAGCILRLCKVLYGLKQSARAWNSLVHRDLVALGYRRTRTDACIYIRVLTNGHRIYPALYVDDILAVAHPDDRKDRKSVV